MRKHPFPAGVWNPLRALSFLNVIFLWGNPVEAGVSRPELADYDGDGLTDIAVYHAAAGDWYIRRSSDEKLRQQRWGWSQREPVPGDYDGDGKTDICVYSCRNGNWYILRSSDSKADLTYNWGSAELDPIVGDFDGDGMNDLAVYHPPTGDWYVERSSDGSRYVQNWGWYAAEPVPGDYDGDGETDVAVYHRDSGDWYIRQSSDGKLRTQNWGWYEAEPVQADYDGDGRTDIAVFHPEKGVWYLRYSGGGSETMKPGWLDVQPVPGHFDADGRADLAAYYPETGYWAIRRSTDGAHVVQNWGWSESEPCSSAYRVDDDGAYYGHSYEHDYDDDDFQENGDYPRTGEDEEPVEETPDTSDLPTSVPSDFNNVTWLHTDVSGWSETAELTVSVSGSRITVDYDKADVWGAVTVNGTQVNANPWIFVPMDDGSGWYAATWEWLRPGQTVKNKSSVAGDHIKKSPLQNFLPKSGVWYGFMVSGLARDSTRNVKERSNIYMLQWP